MIRGEEIRLSVGAMIRRPTESLMLTLSVALSIGSMVAGIMFTSTATTISERLLSSLRYREIIATTTPVSETLDSPARETLPINFELAIDDLHRVRSMTEAVQYAYVADEITLHLRGAGDLWPRRERVSGVRVTPDFFLAKDLAPAAGSLFTPAEVERREPVMVVGSELGATLFEDGETLGRNVVADLRTYRIIGVLERSLTKVDDQAFILAGFVRENYRQSDVGMIKFKGVVNTLRFTVPDRSLLDEARAQVIAYFDTTYGDGVLNITDPRAESHAVADRYRRLMRVILFLALSALLIATLNMSNIFASRALRRRRLAGILKAMGATSTRIFVVFLVEAVVVAVIGSVAGVGMAALLARLMRQEFGFGVLDPGLILAGVAAAWTIVASCSVLPAVAAARTPAAEAIRYE